MTRKEFFLLILIAGLSGGLAGEMGLYFLSLSTAIAQSEEEKLMVAAKSLSNIADECLYDVRDRGFKYDNSRNCTALSALSKQYIDAGGWEDINSLAEHARIANGALTTAWMARAVSAPGDPSLKIW